MRRRAGHSLRRLANIPEGQPESEISRRHTAGAGKLVPARKGGVKGGAIGHYSGAFRFPPRRESGELGRPAPDKGGQRDRVGGAAGGGGPIVAAVAGAAEADATRVGASRARAYARPRARSRRRAASRHEIDRRERPPDLNRSPRAPSGSRHSRSARGRVTLGANPAAP